MLIHRLPSWRLFVALSFAFLVFGFGPNADAAELGSVVGRVETADGLAVTEAEIDLVDLHLHAHVDDQGRFTFENVPAGSYLLRIESAVGGEATRRFKVVAGQPTEITVTLAIIRHDDEVVVTGTAVARSQLELAQPTTVLLGEELRFRQQPTLGETLAQQAGVSSTFFGQGASRPVIRGIGGDRVRMLQGGIDVGDASSTSPDHAVSIEPALAERIEVLHGPATLLYGSSAIGGVVNVIDGHIPSHRAEESVSGFIDLSGGSVAGEKATTLSLDGGSLEGGNSGGRSPKNDAWGWHLDGTWREAGDYDVPGGSVPNSDLESQAATLGATRFFANRGYLGVAVGTFDSNYGIPSEPDSDEGDVRIDLKRLRYDLQGEITQPFGFVQGVKMRLGVVDYEHAEIEDSGDIGSQFFNDTVEGRLEVVQKPRGPLTGSFGLQYVNKQLEAVGEEAFIPLNETSTWALFTFQEIERLGGALRFQFGARAESQQSTNTAGLPERSFDGFSGSAGVVWQPVDGYSVALSLARSTKLPNGEELYSDGPHVATRAFEVGDPNLGEETSVGVDLALRKTSGRLTGELTFFQNSFDDYIYQTFTGDAEDGLPVLLFAQADATFKGVELEARLGLWDNGIQHVDLSFVGDVVRAELDAGDNLPRIPPRRLGVGLHYHRPQWHGYLEFWDIAAQNDVAPNETPTDGYSLVNAGLTYRFFAGEKIYDLVLRGRNLTDQDARNHVSFLKDFAPLPGRDVNLAIRFTF